MNDTESHTGNTTAITTADIHITTTQRNSTNLTTTTNRTSTDKSADDHTGIIVGVVIGCIVFLAISIAVIVFVWKWRQRRRDSKNKDLDITESMKNKATYSVPHNPGPIRSDSSLRHRSETNDSKNLSLYDDGYINTNKPSQDVYAHYADLKDDKTHNPVKEVYANDLSDNKHQHKDDTRKKGNNKLSIEENEQEIYENDSAIKKRTIDSSNETGSGQRAYDKQRKGENSSYNVIGRVEEQDIYVNNSPPDKEKPISYANTQFHQMRCADDIYNNEADNRSMSTPAPHRTLQMSYINYPTDKDTPAVHIYGN